MIPSYSLFAIASPLDLTRLEANVQDAPQETAQESAQESAQTAAGGEGTPPPAQDPGIFGSMWFPMILIFAVFYFVMIGPERKARKKREAMLAAMKKGDQVVTSSGLHGTIAALADDVVTLSVDEGVRLRFSRAAIQTVSESKE
jgi:preprotein translocase subunit YajC